MAALVVQSRFAGLKIEDDELPGDTQKSKKNKTSNAKKAEPAKKSKSATNNNKTQATGKKKKSKAQQDTSQQWEQWKQKDEKLVDDNFEDELQQAILLSKLDYEEKKDVYKQLKKEAELEKKSEKPEKPGKKQKKKNVMSLEQFNDMVAGEDPKQNHQPEESQPSSPLKPEKDEEFFERVRDDVKNELLREKINERVRNQKPMPEEAITRVQFADALERKDKEIAALKQEVVSLKEELLTVKSRNKKLCSILGHGEMRDKAEVLAEVERLRGVQDELTAEIATLNEQLQKERSRTDARPKDRRKKSASDKDK